jgi:hypothetical protein
MQSCRSLCITFLASWTLGVACATSPSSSGVPPARPHSAVSESELAPVGDLTAYDALRRLRPAFLRSRDVSTPSHSPVAVTVFVNGDRTYGVDALKNLLSRTVREIRFYEPAEANVRFGTGNNGGAILVTLK